MLWMIGLPIGLGIGNFIGSIYSASKDRPHKTIEMCSALWFILAVLIYGVLK